MDFITYITKAILKQEPNKNLFEEIISNLYSFKDVKFTESIEVKHVKDLDINYNKNENWIYIAFSLFYKQYMLAEVDIDFYDIFQYDLIGNLERSANIDQSIPQIELGVFNSVFKFELTNKKLILQAKNDTIDFQLKTHYKKINLSIDFLNTIPFIDALEDKEKNNQLFYDICDSISNEQLALISKLDYSSGNETAFLELLSIRNTKTLPENISNETSKVLRLAYNSKSTTKEEHQIKLFVCTIILLENHIFDTNRGFEDVLTELFLTANALGLTYVTRAFFLNLFSAQRLRIDDFHPISYLILGCDLLLKDEKSCSETFNFLQDTYFLQKTNFDFCEIETVKKIEENTLTLLDNTHFIKDKTLKEDLTNLFTSIVHLCKERHDITAIKALFKRTFTKKQIETVLALLPELSTINDKYRYSYLIFKGLNSMQVKIIIHSLHSAEFFLKGFESGSELKRNIFFDTWLKIYKK